MVRVKALHCLIGWIRYLGRALAGGQSGKAAIELALIAPVFLGLLCGILEFSGIMFAQTLLEGGASQASRYGMTGMSKAGMTREEAIAQIVKANSFGLFDVRRINIETLVYEQFDDVGKPEPFADDNDNGTYDPGEAFEDVNGNGVWDKDMGVAGLGGPGDVVVYRMSYDWPIMIAFFRPIFGETVALQANMAVRNEPFG